MIRIRERSFIADYFDENGEGLHHIGVNVFDLDSPVDRLTAVGG